MKMDLDLSLAARRFWIFDLDGTLTVPVHDFDEIRRMFGLPAGRGIIESLDAMPAAHSEPLRRRLDDYEHDLAADSVAAEGAAVLLEALDESGARRGIVTRNSRRNVETTLVAIGMHERFAREDMVTRDCLHSRPKPAPDGVLHLLDVWRADATAAVMVGNHAIDIEAGRAAGTATVLVKQPGPSASPEPVLAPQADLTVDSLCELVDALGDIRSFS